MINLEEILMKNVTEIFPNYQFPTSNEKMWVLSAMREACEQEACAFAEWVIKQNMSFDWETKKWQPYAHPFQTPTTTELYKQFKEEQI